MAAGGWMYCDTSFCVASRRVCDAAFDWNSFVAVLRLRRRCVLPRCIMRVVLFLS